MLNNNIQFVSLTHGWAACEELWSQTAVDLVKQSVFVSAVVIDTGRVDRRVESIKESGVNVQLWPARYSLWRRAWHYFFSRGKTWWALEFQKLQSATPSGFVVFSDGLTYPPIELMEICISMNLPFVTISHKNWGELWPSDENAERFHNALRVARRCYFVSEANLRLAEKQIGFDLPNAEVVRNPYNVDFNSSPAWPASGPQKELRLACVARLDPGQKGQDILFEALASSAWENRDWHLTLYGDGPVKKSLERHAARLGLSNRVTFAGHVSSVEDIWVSNHVLVMPSLYEGLPLAMVEAMLCGRPVLATDVAGHAEVIIDGMTGFLAESPTVGSLARTLERLWADRDNLENMGKAGAKRIRELVPADPAHAFSEKLKLLMS